MVMQRAIEFLEDLKGQLYVEFVKYAFATSSQGYFVVRDEVQKGLNIPIVLERIIPHLISIREVDEWPGTRLHGGLVAKLYGFTLAEPVMRLFLDVTDHIYGWCHPDLPEDIGFRDEQGLVLIQSTIHEHYLSMVFDRSRKAILEIQFPSLAQTLLN
jgi:hypothetical protein